MAADTSIEWTDATWPVVQGCDYESPGCTNCYAVPLLWRMAHNPNAAISGPLQGVVAKNTAGKLHFTGKVALREDRLTWPLQWKEPRKIFVPSHGDLFHPAVPDEFIDRVFAVMSVCPQHTFQVLTKRAERMRRYMTTSAQPIDDPERRDDIVAAAFAIRSELGLRRGEEWFTDDQCFIQQDRWPLPNVWLGVSVEDQARADERIPQLLATPAAKRFLSCEPLLGPVNLDRLPRDPDDEDREMPGFANIERFVSSALMGAHGVIMKPDAPLSGRRQEWWEDLRSRPSVDWVIVGGESGPNSRHFDLRWARDLLAQCRGAGTAYFLKQLGARPFDSTGDLVKNLHLEDRKGGDMAEFPEDLRVREFPT